MTPLFRGLIVGLAVCAACDGGTGPESNYSLSLVPPALTIVQGRTDSVTVTINRANFAAAVVLSLASAPAGVSGSFSTAAPTGDTSTLIVNIAATVPVGLYTLTVNGAGAPGNRSAQLSLTINAPVGPPPPPPPLGAPSDLVFTGASTTGIRLTWHDNSSNESGFRLERAIAADFSQVATVVANVSEYQDTGLTAGTSYHYRVLALDGDVVSPYSNMLLASTCLANQTSPGYRPYRELMALVSCSVPVYVTGSSAVPVIALRDAGAMLEAMLQNRSDIGPILRARGVLTGVFARSETVCDVLYFSMYKGTDLCARGPGGLGGTQSLPATACSEKNVLKQSDDPYQRGTAGGENVCLHELAHTIMNIGLSADDRLRIQERFDSARTEGLWTGDYAMENAEEFFAEMSQTYFCANPETPNALHHGINCAEELRNYDFKTFQLIDGIYRGSSDLR
jgi:hypothetical protein